VIDHPVNYFVVNESSKMLTVRIHNYSKFSLHLPETHQLPSLAAMVPLYDRFLPHLGAYFYDDSLIVDVGANCGDTVVGMYCANPKLKFICIDADDIFYPYLLHNTSRLKAEDPNLFIETINAFVGMGDGVAFLENNGSTSRAADSGSGQKVSKQSLDQLVKPFLNHANRLALIKVDVDGVDYEVIDSGEQIIRTISPMIFFEANYTSNAQYVGFLRTLDKLTCMGYSNWLLLDNYGEIVLSTEDIDAVKQLFDYIHRQNQSRTIRTIVYFDVLAYRDKDKQIVNAAATDFLAGRIK
jgi:FkbM family methyltransferase